MHRKTTHRNAVHEHAGEFSPQYPHGLQARCARHLLLLLSCLGTAGCTSEFSVSLLQWPAMVVTVTASWFVTSRYKDHRWVGFILFLIGNALWAAWGLHTGAHALVVLQVCLAVMNILGIRRASDSSGSAKE